MKKDERYLSHYIFDWEQLNIILSGKSALDSHFFFRQLNSVSQVNSFLESYGFAPNDMVLQAELFGNFQESLQFIRRYFLQEGNPDGLDLHIPYVFLTLTQVQDLFLIASGKRKGCNYEERIWAMVILKVMHTLVHVDKDLRSHYFSEIQKQIFDRFYRYLLKDASGKLFLGETLEQAIPIFEFHTKSKKSRDSIVLKLLHKAENVAEELFDRIGLRFVTYNRFDVLRVVKFLHEQNVIVAYNNKPSRSMNALIDLGAFVPSYRQLIRRALKEGMSEDVFLAYANELAGQCERAEWTHLRNTASSKKYRAVQFTCRQLINYKNPFMAKFAEVRNTAKRLREREGEESSTAELARKIWELDISQIANDVRFFYPFEVQVVDVRTHRSNTKGDASHREYKRGQLRSVTYRLFKPLIEARKIDFTLSEESALSE